MKNVSDVSQSRISKQNKRCAKRYTMQLFRITSLFVYRGKSVFPEALFKKGITTLQDLTTEENGVSQVFKFWQVLHLHLKKSFSLWRL